MGGPAGDLPTFAKAALAGHRAGVQSIQVQFLPRQWGTPVASPDGALQQTISRHRQRRPAGHPAAGPHLPVRRRLHRQHARHRLRALRAPSGQRQRTRAVRHQPRTTKFGPLLRAQLRHRAVALLPDRRATSARWSSPTRAPTPSGRRTRHRGGRGGHRADPGLRRLSSPRAGVFAVARGVVVSGGRFALRHDAGDAIDEYGVISAPSRRAASAAC